MELDVTHVARMLADHALLLLALGLVLLGLAAAAVIAGVKVVASQRAWLVRAWAWAFGRALQVPGLGLMLHRATATAMTSYVAFHLLLGLVALAAATAFAVIAGELVAGRGVAAFDHAFAAALHDSTTPAWRAVFAAVTWCGSREALVTASVVVAAGLLLRRDYVLTAGWLVAQAGGGLLNATLKSAFERTRPESADALLAASSWSFPSGHAMGTFVLCGLGAYLLLRLTRSWSVTIVVVAIALGWCLLMAFSRLYLGVHYLSDVVAGLIAAAAWVAICISGIEIALRRVEPAGQRERDIHHSRMARVHHINGR